MRYKVTAGDVWFYHSLGSYEFDVKCEMLAELGYDGIDYAFWSEPSWADVPRIGSVKERFGIDVASVYAAPEGPHDTAGVARVADLLERLEGCDTFVLAVIGSPAASANSDPAGDAPVLEMISGFADIAERRGITLTLYPHTFCWMERMDDALRLARSLAHPSVKVAWPEHHWYISDGKNLQELFGQAMPLIHMVNINGSRRVPSDNGMPATVELLDEGELDNFHVVGLLKRYGYKNAISIQGYSIGGDVYPKLQRSLAAFRDIEDRIERHPSWVTMRADPLPPASGAE
jgi:sugar phosphate isomerase/epimerase